MPTMAELRQAEERKAREAAEAARRKPAYAPPPSAPYTPPGYVPDTTDDIFDDSLIDVPDYPYPSQGGGGREEPQEERQIAAYYIPPEPLQMFRSLVETGQARASKTNEYLGQFNALVAQGAEAERLTQQYAGVRSGSASRLSQGYAGQRGEPERLSQAYANVRSSDEGAISQQYGALREQHPGRPEGWGLPDKPSAAPPPGYEWVFGGQVIRPGGPGTQPMFQDAAGRWLLQKVVQTTAKGTGGGGGGGYSQRPYQSYGHGGYSSAGAGAAPETPEPMGELAWWGPDALPPLLRQWGSWLQELVAANAGTKPIPFPLMQDEDAIKAEQEMMQEAQKEGAVKGPGLGAGGMTYSQVVQQLNNSLGLSYDDKSSDTVKWQQLVSSLPNADFETQQLVAGLRFNQSGTWYHQNVSQMLNPRYT